MDSVIATAAQNGFDGPDAWYKVIMNGIDNEDNAGMYLKLQHLLEAALMR